MKGEGLCSNTIVKILAAKIFLLFYVLSHSFWAMFTSPFYGYFLFHHGEFSRGRGYATKHCVTETTVKQPLDRVAKRILTNSTFTIPTACSNKLGFNNQYSSHQKDAILSLTEVYRKKISLTEVHFENMFHLII
jgi:hypothetical protein